MYLLATMNGVVSGAQFFERNFAAPLAIGYHLFLGLKPGHPCDAISVVVEFMVGVAGVEARPPV
jgi:hypothetical protein